MKFPSDVLKFRIFFQARAMKTKFLDFSRNFEMISIENCQNSLHKTCKSIGIYHQNFRERTYVLIVLGAGHIQSKNRFRQT